MRIADFVADFMPQRGQDFCKSLFSVFVPLWLGAPSGSGWVVRKRHAHQCSHKTYPALV
jgi:hypothetical protein